jgi:toxin ParE1/3/4
MALSVRFHPAARAQLFNLYEYIAAETGRERAGGFIDRIEASCLSLGTFPEMGRKAEDLGPDLRLHPFERRAMIVYRVTPEAVEVLGFTTEAATWPPTQSRQRAISTPFPSWLRPPVPSLSPALLRPHPFVSGYAPHPHFKTRECVFCSGTLHWGFMGADTGQCCSPRNLGSCVNSNVRHNAEHLGLRPSGSD